MDIVHEVARHLASTSYDDLGAETREQTKRFILDSLAVAAAGLRLPAIEGLTAVIAAQGGAAESTVVGHPQRFPATSAALLNGSLIQSWEYDDAHDDAFLHSYSSVLPAALAIGERQASPGGDVIAAVCLGVDLACRLSLVVAQGRGFYHSATCGGFGAAAAAAKLMGLDELGILNSLGIVLSQTAGTSQASTDGADSKCLQCGFAARAGVLSALLAAQGVSGARNVFEGAFGFFNLYMKSAADPAPLTSGLGETYLGDTLSFKPYPCCRGSHGAIDAALSMRSQHSISAGDIERMSVSLPPVFFDFLNKQVELNERALIDAQFSAPYLIACAMLRGEVSLTQFTPAAIGDPEVQKLAHAVSVRKDESITSPRAAAPVTVEVRLTSGKVFIHTVETLRGSPARPPSDAELVAKARECIAFARSAALEDNIDRFIETTLALDELDDVGRLLQLLRG